MHTGLVAASRPSPTIPQQPVNEWEVFGATRTLSALPVPDRRCPTVRWLGVAPWFGIQLSGPGTYTDIDSHGVAQLRDRSIGALGCDYLHVTGYDRDHVPIAPLPPAGAKLTAVTSRQGAETIQEAVADVGGIGCGNADTAHQIAAYYDLFPPAQRAEAVNMVEFDGYRRVVITASGSRRLLLDVGSWTPGNPNGGDLSGPGTDCPLLPG